MGKLKADRVSHLTIGEPLRREVEAPADQSQLTGNFDEDLTRSRIRWIDPLATVTKLLA